MSLQPTVLTGTCHPFGEGHSALGVRCSVNNRNSSQELPFYCNFNEEGRLRNLAAGLLINCFNSPVRHSQGDLVDILISVDFNGILIAR